jgi:hypothetical protein
MRVLKIALLALALASSASFSGAPAGAVTAPTPLPRPTSGGARPTYCPQDGNVSIALATPGGKTTFKVGDTVTVLATVTAGVCDVIKMNVGLHTGAGLSDPVASGLISSLPANTTGTQTMQARALQAGTWTYTGYVAGDVFGTTLDLDSSCNAYTNGTTSGWSCQRAAQAPVTITITASGSSGAGSTSGTSTSGSSAGASAGSPAQTAGGDSQTTPGSAPPLVTTGAVAPARGGSVRNPLLIVGLLLLVGLALAAAGAVLLMRRRMASGPSESPG